MDHTLKIKLKIRALSEKFILVVLYSPCLLTNIKPQAYTNLTSTEISLEISSLKQIIIHIDRFELVASKCWKMFLKSSRFIGNTLLLNKQCLFIIQIIKLHKSQSMVYPNRIKPFWMLIKYLDLVLVSWNQSQHRLQVEPQRTNVMIFKSTIKLLSQTKSTFIIIFRWWPYRNIFRSILY